MKKIFVILFALVLVVSLAFTACAPDGNGNGNGKGDEIVVQEWDLAVHGEVTFYQQEWMEWGDGAPEPLYPSSNVGTVQFLFSDGAGEWFLAEHGGGWLNVVIDTTSHNGSEQWAVQNLYLVYDDLDFLLGSAPTVQFSLGLVDPDIPLPLLEAAVFLSSEPLEEQPEAEALVDYPVILEPYLVGGFNGGGSAISDIPFIIGPWIGPTSLPVRVATINITAANITAIDEGHAGCFPGSAARSISYLGEVHNFDTHDPMHMYGDLVEFMGTDICGTGTTGDDALSGKNSYCLANNWTINSHIVYTDTYDPTGGSSWADLMKQVQDDLDAGCDVEILIRWSRGGGHAAMVTAVTRHADGSATIGYVDDPNQGDGKAENEEHVIATDDSGNFRTGTVCGFMIECVPS